VHYGVLALCLLSGLVWIATRSFGPITDWPLGSVALAMLLYLAAHGMRALRFAIISSSLLGLSGRSGALLHFVTSPGAMVLPFKLGEVLRLHQLWYLSRQITGSVLVIVLERFFDGLMLLALLIVIFFVQPAPEPATQILLVATLSAVTLGLVVLGLGQKPFRAVQTYIVVHHQNPKTLGLLGQIDLAGNALDAATRFLRSHGFVLLVLSFLVWGLEVVAAVVFVSDVLGGLPLLVERLVGWHVLPQSDVGLFSLMCLLAVLAAWPIALLFYLPRIPHEPLRRQSLTDGEL